MRTSCHLKRTWAPVFGALLVLGLLATAQEAPSSAADNRLKRIRVSQDVAHANLIKKVQPAYPEAARAAGAEGSIVLTAIIAASGAIQELRLNSGDPLLVPAAMDAVRQWVYKPYLLKDEPIEVETTITVKFRLHNPGPYAVLLLSPPEGAMEHNLYNNPKLGLALELPAGWKHIRMLVGGYTPAKGFEKLLAAGEGPENWLLVSSFQSSQADATAKVGAYLVWGQELQTAGYSVEPKTQEIKVSGKKLFRLNYTGTVAETLFHCALFITGHNKNVVLLEFCASNRTALDSALTSVQTLNLTKVKKEK